MNSIIDGSSNAKIPSSLMGQPTSADHGKFSGIDGPTDVGSDNFVPDSGGIIHIIMHGTVSID